LLELEPEPQREVDDRFVDDVLSLHGGLWSRPVPDDGLGVRCAEHGLRPDEH
jgi:hypothetical protein